MRRPRTYQLLERLRSPSRKKSSLTDGNIFAPLSLFVSSNPTGDNPMAFDVRACALSGAMISLACLAPFAATDAAASWVNTATQAIPLVNAVPLGAVNPATSMRITVALQMQNTAALKSLVQAQNTPGSSTYHKFLTPAQFDKTYAPSNAAVNVVSTYLKKSGLGQITVAPNH